MIGTLSLGTVCIQGGMIQKVREKLISGLEGIAQGADPLDFYLHHVSWFHRANPSRGSCADDVSREEGHALGKIVDQKGHGKD